MLLSVSKILTMLFNIASAKILSMGLTTVEYGTYSQANLIYDLGTNLILLGMPDALNFYFHRKEEGYTDETRKRVVNTVFFLEFVMGAILAAVILIGQDAVAAYFGNQSVKAFLPIVSILPVCANTVYLYQTLTVTVGKAKLTTISSLLMTVSRLVAVSLTVFVFHNILWIYIMIFFMDAVQVTIFHIAIRKKGVHINPAKIQPDYIKKIFALGIPMGIYALTAALTRDLDKLVIGRLADTETMAIYTNASKILPLTIIVYSFAMVLIPYVYRRVAEGKREESADLFRSYLKVGYYSVWTLGVMVLVAPESVISMLYADAYIAGKNIFILYVFDSMLRFASMHLILTAAGKNKLVMYFSLLSLGLNFVLNLLFFYLWGMIGPAIATLVVALVYTFLILGSTIKTIESRWSEIFDWKDLGIFTATLAAVWLCCFFANKGLLAIGLHRYVAMFISMAIFGLSILAIHRKRIFGVLKKINSYKL